MHIHAPPHPRRPPRPSPLPADSLIKHPAGIECLKLALSVPVLDLPCVDQHMQQLGEVLGDDIHAVAADVYARISAHTTLPRPKYFAPR